MPLICCLYVIIAVTLTKEATCLCMCFNSLPLNVFFSFLSIFFVLFQLFSHFSSPLYIAQPERKPGVHSNLLYSVRGISLTLLILYTYESCCWLILPEVQLNYSFQYCMCHVILPSNDCAFFRYITFLFDIVITVLVSCSCVCVGGDWRRHLSMSFL